MKITNQLSKDAMEWAIQVHVCTWAWEKYRTKTEKLVNSGILPLEMQPYILLQCGGNIDENLIKRGWRLAHNRAIPPCNALICRIRENTYACRQGDDEYIFLYDDEILRLISYDEISSKHKREIAHFLGVCAWELLKKEFFVGVGFH